MVIELIGDSREKTKIVTLGLLTFTRLRCVIAAGNRSNKRS